MSVQENNALVSTELLLGLGKGGMMQIINEKKLIPVLLVQQLLRNCSGSVKSSLQFDARNTMFN